LSKAKVSEQAAKLVLPPKEQVLPAARTEAGERALTPANNKEVVNNPAVREVSIFMISSKRELNPVKLNDKGLSKRAQSSTNEAEMMHAVYRRNMAHDPHS